MRNAFAFAFTIALALAGLATRPLGAQVAPATTTAPWTCYELALVGADDEVAELFPGTVSLEWGESSGKVVSLPSTASREFWPMFRGPRSRWVRQGADSVLLTFTNGLSTVALRLRRFADSLQGTGRVHFDHVGAKPPEARVVGWARPCRRSDIVGPENDPAVLREIARHEEYLERFRLAADSLADLPMPLAGTYRFELRLSDGTLATAFGRTVARASDPTTRDESDFVDAEGRRWPRITGFSLAMMVAHALDSLPTVYRPGVVAGASSGRLTIDGDARPPADGRWTGSADVLYALSWAVTRGELDAALLRTVDRRFRDDTTQWTDRTVATYTLSPAGDARVVMTALGTRGDTIYRVTGERISRETLWDCETQKAPPFGCAGPERERRRTYRFEPGVTATIVRPTVLRSDRDVDLILYALPNGNTTAQTMGRLMRPGLDWHYDIQHIAAQTRVARALGLPNAVVVYLEADDRSWPAWRSSQGLPVANARIVEIVDSLRTIVGALGRTRVTLTGHSGGGSFAFGFIDGQPRIPDWIDRIAFLDSNYGFEARHADGLLAWLQRDGAHRLEVVAYDDREITLNGKKVVSDSGGTWRATQRMIDAFGARGVRFEADTLGAFLRQRTSQIELLRHPNPQNRILHTEMIGEMNAYLHVLLRGRPRYDSGAGVLGTPRVYMGKVQPD